MHVPHMFNVIVLEFWFYIQTSPPAMVCTYVARFQWRRHAARKQAHLQHSYILKPKSAQVDTGASMCSHENGWKNFLTISSSIFYYSKHKS